MVWVDFMPWVERGNARIWYEARGSGLPVLLTHGYGASSAMWARQLESLPEGIRRIVWDMRGHGRTQAPADPAAYSEEATVGDMAAILDACKVGRAVVGGLSLGGYMSLAFRLRHPGRVRALMLFDTGPGFRKDTARDEWNRFAEDQARALEAKGLDALQDSAEVRATEHTSVEGLILAARGMLTQRDARVIDSLGSIDVPTLVLWGANDGDFVAPGEYMARKIPGARKVVVPDAGHGVNLDQPEAFEAAVHSFLESLPQEVTE